MPETRANHEPVAPLILRIRAATEAARRRANSMRAAQQQEKVAQAASLVRALEGTMSRGWSQIRTLRAHGLNPAVPATALGGLRGVVSEAAQLAGTDVDALVSPRRFDMKRLERQINDVSTKLEVAAKAVWQDYVVRQRPQIDELLNVLANLQAYRRAVAGIRERDEQVQRILSQAPASEDQWRDAHSPLEGLRQAAAQFTAGLGADLPPAVAHFLRRAGGTAGATVADLTEVVREWLRTHSVEAEFAIVVRGNLATPGQAGIGGR